jgi:hypothetical protein
MRVGGNRMLWVTKRRRGSRAPVFLLLILSGCGSELAKVQGTVSLNGERVAGGRAVRGTVLFSPREKGQPTGNGVLDESGEYSVFVGATEGLPPGPYAVAVAVTEVVPAKVPGGTPSGKLITPIRYADPRNSGLVVDVVAGSNTFDFQLQSDR